MKVLKYFIKHGDKVIGIFSSRQNACTFWNSIVCNHPDQIDDYRIIEHPVEQEDDSVYNYFWEIK